MRSHIRKLSALLLLGLMTILGLSLPRVADAVVLKTFEYTFPDPNTSIGEPDPSVWASSGNLNPQPSSRGLLISDPDNASSLVYFHSATEIGAPGNATTFRVTCASEPTSDSSTAWSNDAIGVRIILDDSQKRVVLGFGRDPATKARQIVFLGATGVAAIPFPWDNRFGHVYEIGRVGNGDFVVSVSDGDPNTSNPPIVRNIPAAQLPPSTGPAMAAWGMGAAGGGVSFWAEVRGEVFEAQTDIGLDTTELEIELSAELEENEIEWKGGLSLPPGVTIDPIVEGFSIRLAGNAGIVFETEIGPGQFVSQGTGFRFKSAEGTLPEIEVKLRRRGESHWRFEIEVENLPLEVADKTQITGTLAIGNKVGTQTLPLTDKGKQLEFKKHGHRRN